MAAHFVPSASSADQQDVFAFFVSSFNDITDQLAKGIPAPTVAFNKISALGLGGIDIWKSYIEGATKARFEFRVDVAANAVTLVPVEHMSSKVAATPSLSANNSAATTAASSPITDVAGKPSPPKGRVPRPPNAFIIYRQEWHPKVVKEHPDLHNNQISVIIGRKWKAESETVRYEYKRRAEDAKNRHAAENPGYQYQPRKPSEKRKRMTKSKLAKLRSRKDAVVTVDSMQELDDMLQQVSAGKDITIDTIQAPVLQGANQLQQSGPNGTSLTIDANGEFGSILHSQIASWNHSNPRQMSSFQQPAALISMPLTGGQETQFVPHYALPPNLSQQTGFCGYPSWVPGTTGYAFHGDNELATAEVERQKRIAEDSFNDLFNFEACTDAESTLDHFSEDFTFNFGGGHNV